MGGRRQVALYVSSKGRYMGFPHFRHGQCMMDMNHYTNAELVDIHFILGLDNGNGRAAVLDGPADSMDTHIRRGCIPGTSVQVLAVSTERSRTTIHRVLLGKALLPYHMYKECSYYSQMIIHDVYRWRNVTVNTHFIRTNSYADQLIILNDPRYARSVTHLGNEQVRKKWKCDGGRLVYPFLCVVECISGRCDIFQRDVLPLLAGLSGDIFQQETEGCGSPMNKVSDHGRHVMSSSPVPQKTHCVGQRCTLNLSRVETSSHWCGVVVRSGVASSGVIHVP
ncbi:hypothetical protein TNCV_5102531 [Trichonephila clavipes]|nr:hypothetical protein TNCV_5102531 [Trichonephila clavipes]